MKIQFRPSILTLACLAASGATVAAPCKGAIDASSPVLASGFGYDLSKTRNNPSSINSTNVGSLEVAHVNVAADPEIKERRGAPIVTKQTIYTSQGFNVVAIDRATGCQYWSYTMPSSKELTGGDKVRSLAYVPASFLKPALIIAGDNTRNMHAVNAKTGAVVWKAKIGTEDRYHKSTGAPLVFAGKLFVPVSSKEVLKAPLDVFVACCKSHGMVQALDAYTGKIIWSYHTTPDAKLQWDGHQGPNGAPVWATPTLDVRRNTLYIGTGQNYTYPTTNTSDAIIALNASTGTVKWVFQAVKDDSWNGGCSLPAPLNGTCDEPQGADLDFGAAPVLATLRNGQNLLIAGNKAGTLFALNPDTGKQVWKRQLGKGSNLGGIHWGVAVDSDRAYVGVSDIFVNKISAIHSLDFGSLTAANMALVPDGKPGAYAVDLLTGNVVWEDHATHVSPVDGKTYPSIYSAAASVTNDVVFFATLDGKVRAHRSTDGRQLWAYDTAKTVKDPDGVEGKGGTTDQVGAYIAGNNVLLNSGYYHFGGQNVFQAGEGNALYVFKLPGSN